METDTMMEKTDTTPSGLLLALIITLTAAASVIGQGTRIPLGDSPITAALTLILVIAAAIMTWDTIPETLLSVAKLSHRKVQERDERVALFLKVCVGGPITAYVLICTVTLYLFVIPNVLMSQYIIDHLNLSGEAFISVIGANLLTGYVGAKAIRE